MTNKIGIVQNFDAFDMFLHNKDMKNITINNYKSRLDKFKQFLLERNIDKLSDIAIEDVVDYKKYLMDDDNTSINTKASYITVVKSFFTWCQSIGVPNLAKTIKCISPPTEYSKGGITVEQHNKIIEDIKPCHYKKKAQYYAYRDKVMISFAFTTGARQISMRKLRWKDVKIEDIDGNAMVIATIVVKGVGIRTHDVVINNKTKQLMIEYRNYLDGIYGAENIDSWYVFGLNGKPLSDSGIRYTIRTILQRHGIYKKNKITPHCFRHGVAKYMLGVSDDITIVQEHLGHSSIESTKCYTRKEVRLRSLKKSESILDMI